MELKQLKDEELLQRTWALVREEQKVTELLLKHFEEVERRGLHLDRGYGGLFDWACTELGYTEDQAQYRIDAMRTLRDVPEAQVALGQGRLKLTHLVKVQRFFRSEKKMGRPYSKEAQREVLKELEGASVRECERRLAERLPEPTFSESIRPVAGGRTQITFTAGPELAAELEQLRLVWGLETYGELLERMVRVVSKQPVPPQLSVPVENRVPQGRYISQSLRRQIRKRDENRCSYVSPETGRRCESMYALQIDHLKPYALGGGHTSENLRLLCRAHNAWSARKVFGDHKRV